MTIFWCWFWDNFLAKKGWHFCGKMAWEGEVLVRSCCWFCLRRKFWSFKGWKIAVYCVLMMSHCCDFLKRKKMLPFLRVFLLLWGGVRRWNFCSWGVPVQRWRNCGWFLFCGERVGCWSLKEISRCSPSLFELLCLGKKNHVGPSLESKNAEQSYFSPKETWVPCEFG